MKLVATTILIAAFCSTAAFALMSDFNGRYLKVPTITDPWCGRSIEIQKIRFNTYRISLELITGDRSVVDLAGKAEGDTLDFPSREELAAVLEELGLRTLSKRIDQGYLHPHCVVVGTRSSDPTEG